MSAKRLALHLYVESLPEDAIEATLDVIEDVGYPALPGEEPGYSYGYTDRGDEAPEEWIEKRTTDRTEALDWLRSSDYRVLEYRHGDRQRFSVGFQFQNAGSPDQNAVWINGRHYGTYDHEDLGRSRAAERTEILVELFTGLAEIYEPWYGAAHIYDYYPEEMFPDNVPPVSGIERLPWLAFFGSAWYDRFGGRQRILDAPAWETRGLDGGVLVREYELPLDWRDQDERDPPISTYRYLFEDRSRDDLYAERRRKQQTIRDPFLDLEPGSFGTDVVACRGHLLADAADLDHTGPDLDYTDIAERFDMENECCVLAVRRNEDDCLRDLHTGMFVRRLVDTDGEPIGDLPDDVPQRRELISLAVRNELDVLPSEMYVMDDPDDSSMIAKLWGLAGPSLRTEFWDEEGRCPSGPEEDTD